MRSSNKRQQDLREGLAKNAKKKFQRVVTKSLQNREVQSAFVKRPGDFVNVQNSQF